MKKVIKKDSLCFYINGKGKKNPGEKKKLLSLKKYYKNRQHLFDKTITSVKKLCGVKQFAVSEVPVYLFISKYKNSDIQAWYSWTPNKSSIVVEISPSFKISKNLFPVAVLAHEFFHLTLKRNKKITSKIQEAAKKNAKILNRLPREKMPANKLLEELLISSFIPEGYLSEKHLGMSAKPCYSKSNDLLSLRKKTALKLRNIAKEYVEKGKQIDDKFLKQVIL